MRKVKFGDVVEEVKNNVDRAANPYEFYVAGDHMDSENLHVERRGRFATDDVGPAFTRIFNPGDILYGSRRTYLKKVAVADFSGICANTTFVLRTKNSELFSQDLLPFLMLSEDFTQWSISHSKGSTNPYILFKDLASYEFELPSLEEQKILAEKLWAAYRLKEAYQRLLKATDEMVKSQFLEMFGTIESPKCEVKALHEVCTGSGQYGANVSADIYDIGKPRYIRITDINDEGGLNSDAVSAETYDTKYYLNKGDLLFARTGATVGKTYLHKEGDAMFAGYLIRYIPNTNYIHPEYLLAYTHSQGYWNWVNKTKKVGAQPNISATQYDEMPLLVPATELQAQFETIYRQADKSKFYELN